MSFMIPLGIGVGAKVIKNMVESDRNDARANSINIKSLNRLGESQRLLNEQIEKTEMAIEKLANRKKGILCTSMNDFINVYNKIIKINFKEESELKEFKSIGKTIIDLKEMNSMIMTAGFSMSTSQLISTYIIKGSISGIILKESEANIAAAHMRKKQINVSISQNKTINMALDAIYKRAERISDLLAKLNIIFRKSINTTTSIINCKGENRNLYDEEEKRKFMTCINLASAIKSIIDSPLLDNDGEITQKSLEAISLGDKYLKQLNNLVSE